jgi:hypothetical protein
LPTRTTVFLFFSTHLFFRGVLSSSRHTYFAAGVSGEAIEQLNQKQEKMSSGYVFSYHEKILQYFHYNASTIGSCVWIALFGIVTIYGFFISLKYPNAKFMFIFVASGAIECVGYGTRLESILHPVLAPFIVSVLCILLSPIFLALVNYIVVGRLIEPSGKRIGFISPKSISYVFFASDFTGLIVQGIGGSVLASAKTQSAFTLGSNIILAGLALQVGFFTIFTYMMLVAAYGKKFRMYDREDLKATFNTLFATTILIYIRNIFRLIEYAVPHSSYIPTHEWLFFTFESAPIFLVCAIYCIWHFGAMVPEEFMESHEAREKKKAISPVNTYANVNSKDNGVELIANDGHSGMERV